MTISKLHPSGPRRWADYLLANAGRIAEHRSAPGLLFLLELAGCTVVPFPNALVMVAFVTAAPRRWVRFAASASLGSAVGGLTLYLAGKLFFESVGQSLIAFYGSESRWAGVIEWFNSEWGIAFVLFAGVTTGLFRVACLGAGFTGMDPLLFLAALCASRCFRWFAECGTIKYLGDRIRTWPRHYFKYAAVGAMVAFIATFLIVALSA